MNVEIDNKIGKEGIWAEGVQRANDILRMVLGPSASSVQAKWQLKTDEKGRPHLWLTLCDFTGTADGMLAADELQNSDRLWDRLHRLWGDLLQTSSHRILDELLRAEPAGKEG